jgi:hypothetical protein
VACAATVTATEGKLVCREAGAPIWLPLGPVTNETPGNPYMAQAAPDVLVKLIGTYWLPAAPPPTLVCRPTERFAVAQAARPDAVVDRAVGATAGEVVAGAALAVAEAELLAVVATECGAVALPEDPQPAAVATAATSQPAARPRRALTESLIIPTPFVFGPAGSA